MKCDFLYTETEPTATLPQEQPGDMILIAPNPNATEATEAVEDMILIAPNPNATEATEATTLATEPQLVFEPTNFVDNLSYMGIGMLTIFMIIGVIILTTLGINKLFSRKK